MLFENLQDKDEKEIVKKFHCEGDFSGLRIPRFSLEVDLAETGFSSLIYSVYEKSEFSKMNPSERDMATFLLDKIIKDISRQMIYDFIHGNTEIKNLISLQDINYIRRIFS